MSFNNYKPPVTTWTEIQNLAITQETPSLPPQTMMPFPHSGNHRSDFSHYGLL